MNMTLPSPALRTAASIRQQVGEVEWDARVQLAAAYRLTALHDMTEMVAKSHLLPGT